MLQIVDFVQYKFEQIMKQRRICAFCPSYRRSDSWLFLFSRTLKVVIVYVS